MAQPTAEATNRGPVEIEARCPVCGWYVLVPPETVDMPCPCVANEMKPGTCPGRISAVKHATMGDYRTLVEFKRRVASLLREIEWEAGGHEDACPVCSARSTGPRGHPIPKIHRPDCALAALLSECESALWPALSQVELAENPLPEQRDEIARERRRLQGG